PAARPRARRARAGRRHRAHRRGAGRSLSAAHAHRLGRAAQRGPEEPARLGRHLRRLGPEPRVADLRRRPHPRQRGGAGRARRAGAGALRADPAARARGGRDLAGRARARAGAAARARGGGRGQPRGGGAGAAAVRERARRLPRRARRGALAAALRGPARAERDGGHDQPRDALRRARRRLGAGRGAAPAMTRARFVAAALAAVAALALVVALLRTPSGAAPAPAPAAERAVRAEAWIAETTPIRETVRTVGTLAANESVDVVSELSRRLVSVDVEEGGLVEEGQRLFQLDDADLRAQLAELEARRVFAARTEQRQRELLAFEKKALSQQAYDQAVAYLGEVEAQIAALKVTLAKTEIRAPFRARVGLRRVSEGAWITPDTVLTTLQDTSRIKVDFTLPERYAGAVAVGQPFRF